MEESLKTKVSKYKGFPIVSLDGELDISSFEKIEEIRYEIEIAPLMIVDFTKLNYICCDGLRWLTSWRAINGGMILVIALSPNIKRVLEISGLLPFFSTFSCVDSACEAIDSLLKIGHGPS